MAHHAPRGTNTTLNVTNSPALHHQRNDGSALMPFTFGIEIEFLFLVRGAINQDPNHPLYIRDDQVREDTGVRHQRFSSRGFNILRALCQTQRIITKTVGVDKLQVFLLTPSSIKYNKWHLTTEMVAKTGANLANVDRWTRGMVNANNWLHWSYFGQELISRVLQVPDLSTREASPGDLREVSQFFRALRQPDPANYHMVSEIENSGFHVHIGLPNATNAGLGDTQSQLNLKFLQHLAFILIEYEHIISLLHHPQRRGFVNTKTDNIAQTNRTGILGHPHTCGLYPLPTLAAVRDVIFAPDMTINRLATLMDENGLGATPVINVDRVLPNPNPNRTRYKFVNWENLVRAGPQRSRWADDDHSIDVKRTVEFRQHHGTLDYSPDIEQWLIFVFSLVRAAETKARFDVSPAVSPSSPTFTKPPDLQWSVRQVRKYPSMLRTKNEALMLENLFVLLDLSRTQCAYWRSRFHKYDAQAASSDGKRVADEPWYQGCAECALAAIRYDHEKLNAGRRLLNHRSTLAVRRLTNVDAKIRRISRRSTKPPRRLQRRHDRKYRRFIEASGDAEVFRHALDSISANQWRVRRNTQAYYTIKDGGSNKSDDDGSDDSLSKPPSVGDISRPSTPRANPPPGSPPGPPTALAPAPAAAPAPARTRTRDPRRDPSRGRTLQRSPSPHARNRNRPQRRSNRSAIRRTRKRDAQRIATRHVRFNPYVAQIPQIPDHLHPRNPGTRRRLDGLPTRQSVAGGRVTKPTKRIPRGAAAKTALERRNHLKREVYDSRSAHEFDQLIGGLYM